MRGLVAAITAGVLVLGGGPAVAAEPTEAVTPAAGGFDFTKPNVVASGLTIPWGMGFLPDGSALVNQRNSAQILQMRPGTAPRVVARVPGVVASGEGGLLGLAVSPTYAQDRYVYVYYTASSDNRIARLRLDGTAPQVIRTGIPKANIHDGGRIKFGPDGKLYAGTGDAANSSNAQNPRSLGGKILRMNPDGSVPADNPTAGSVVYTLGHRNVQGLAWDAQGQLWASELGQNTWDEVNKITAGKNYGWPTCEGRCNDARFVNPYHTWTTAEASPSGAEIANNTMFVAALRGQRLWLVPLAGGSPTAVLRGTYGRLRTVVKGPDGWLWVASSNGSGRDRVVRFPPG